MTVSGPRTRAVTSTLRDHGLDPAARRDGCHSPIMSSACSTRSRARSTPRTRSSRRVCVAANLRAPSTRRRLQGAALFVLGLAMLVCGCAVQGHHDRRFLIVSVIGFVVMFAGVVFAITGPRVTGRRTSPTPQPGAPRAEASQGLRRIVHQSHGGPVPPSVRRVTLLPATRLTRAAERAAPFLCRVPHACPTTAPAPLSAQLNSVFRSRHACHVGRGPAEIACGPRGDRGATPATCGMNWSKVGDCGV